MKVAVNIRSRSMLRKFSDEELTQLAGRVGLTLEQLKDVHRAAHAVYGYIGVDLAEANDGKPMKRYDLVEVILDANRIENHGWSNHDKFDAWPGGQKGMREYFATKTSKFDLDDLYAAVAADFPYPLYE